MKMLIAGVKKTVGSAMTRHSKAQKTLLVCGFLSALIWMGADIIGSLRYEGYNYPFAAISGLTTLDSPTRSLVIPLDILFTVLKIVFAVGVWMAAYQKRSLRITAGLLFTSGIVDLVANFFPWDPSEAVGTLGNIIHGILAGGLIGLLYLLTIGFGANTDGKWFRYYSYGTLLAIIVASSVMGLFGDIRMEGNLPPPWFGLAERINAYGLMLWMMTLAVLLLRLKPARSSLADRPEVINPGVVTS